MSVLQTILDGLESEIILPAQFFDAMRPGTTSNGERRLAFAVLSDGLNCFLRYANSKTVAGQKLFSEAQDWIFSTTARGLFGFENLCDTFDIGPNLLRRALTEMNPPTGWSTWSRDMSLRAVTRRRSCPGGPRAARSIAPPSGIRRARPSQSPRLTSAAP
jgi:hypothetical protein